MAEIDHDPDPPKRAPTFMWMALALIVVAMFAAVASLHGNPGPRSVYGPPAGAPSTH